MSDLGTDRARAAESTQIAPEPLVGHTAADQATDTAARRGRAQAWLPVLPAIAFLIFVSLAGYDGRLRLSHDAGIYVSLGQSLCTGQGYRDIHLADAPLHRQYPPMFPLMLAAAICPAGVDTLAITGLILVMAAGALAAVYALFRELRGPRTAWRVVTLTAVSPATLYYFHAPMSEALYVLCSALALWSVVRPPSTGRPRSWADSAVTAALLATASLTRLVGLSLVAAVCLHALLEPRARLGVRIRSALIMGTGALPLVAWITWNRLQGYAAGTTYVQYYRGELSSHLTDKPVLVGMMGQLKQALRRLYDYMFHVGGLISYPLDSVIATSLAPAAALIVFAGFLYCAVRRRTVLEYYVVAYFALLLPFPGSRQQRYLIPLIPIIWYYFVTAIARAYHWAVRARWLTRARSRPVAYALRGAVVALLLGHMAASVLLVHFDEGRGVASQRSLEAYQDVYRWVKQHTPPASRMAWANPGVGFVVTGRKAVRIPRGQPSAVVSELLGAGANYVVVDSEWRASRPLERAIVAYPERFRLSYQTEIARVYEVLRDIPPAPGASSQPTG